MLICQKRTLAFRPFGSHMFHLELKVPKGQVCSCLSKDIIIKKEFD